MTYAAITGWGKCMPPAVLTNADLATFIETDDEWITSRTGIRERRISHVPAHRARPRRGRAGARLRGAGREGPRPHRPRQLLLRRAGAQQRLRRAGAAGRGPRGRHGREHGLHQLPLRAFHRQRDDPHRRGAQRRGDRRGGDLALHGLDQPQRGRALRRRRGRRGAAGDRGEGRTARREAGLLRRRAPYPARARHGRGLREPRHPGGRHAAGTSTARRSSSAPCTG